MREALHRDLSDPARLGLRREEPLADGLGCLARDRLHAVHVQRQLAEDLAHRPVLEVVADLAERPEDVVRVPDPVRARVDGAHAVLGALDRVDDRAREQPVQQQELRGVARARHAAIGPQIRLVGAARAQDRRPRRAGCLGQRPRGEQARRHVGALDAASEREELPGLVAARRGVDDAHGESRSLAHPLEELVHLVDLQASRHPCIRGVERLPQLGRHDLASPTGVLARGGERVRDARGVHAVDGEAGEHVLAADRLDALRGERAHDLQERPAGGVLVDPRVFEQQLQVHVEDARGAVAALDVAPDPEQRLGDAAQHGRSPRSPTRATAAAAPAARCASAGGPAASAWARADRRR